MHAIEERYYKINRIILKTLGLWPYQQSYLTQIHKILFAGILWTFILVQLLVFITTQYNINLLLKILSLVFPTLFGTIKYILFIIQADSVKQLLEQVRNDWRLLKNKLEIDIIEKYACNSRLFTMIVMAFCLLGVIFCTIFQLLPMILDIIIPLNKSRPCQIIAVTEYFINQEKYIYAILLHEIITVLIIAITIFGTGATIMMYILHACALFEVARRERFLYRRIVHAVVIHRRAIDSSLKVYRIFNIYFYGIICYSDHSWHQLFKFQSFSISSNEITDHGIKFFKATYNGLWYAAPLHTQKLLLFVMRKGKINVTIGCGSLFIASLEGFAMLTNTAVSYFTVIYSTR
ncbi:uncharacterized protein LOC112637621 isoform X3 [Camponotus floridanus]|uniref:uncharacterized protein LOC112637621 isoform X3 n=1 Tax=Camponotus floridanus TaxID=104421 RepID=UPI000DC697CC|nr:uncharacterized protein LOC112637621 isoform X3 [Camponotus floridanus]